MKPQDNCKIRIYTKMFNENIVTNLAAKSNKIFKRLCSHKLISENELKYFTQNFKKATNQSLKVVFFA